MFTKYVLFSSIVYFCISRHQSIAKELPPEAMQLFIANRPPCVKETNVDTRLIDRVNEGEHITDSTFKCYVKCKFMADKLMSPTGDIVKEQFEKIYGKEYMANLSSGFENCVLSVTSDSNLCDKATNFAYCFRDLDPDTLKIY